MKIYVVQSKAYIQGVIKKNFHRKNKEITKVV